MTQLAPCPHCHRHVRRDEAACPFCETRLPVSFARPVVRPRPPRGVGRAVAFAFAAGAASMGTVGCTESTDAITDSGTPDGSIPDAGAPDAATNDGAIPIYAAAPTPDDGTRMASAGDAREPTDDA